MTSALSYYRNKAGLSQTALQKLCGWREGNARISSYETGRSEPPISALKKIAEVLNRFGLGITFEDLARPVCEQELENKREFVLKCGWYPYYHLDYVVHPKMPEMTGLIHADKTMLGLSVDEAYRFEKDALFRDYVLDRIRSGYNAARTLSELTENTHSSPPAELPPDIQTA